QYIYTYDDSGKSTTTTLQCSHGDTCQPVKFSCTESHCSTTYTDNIVAFDYTTLPTIVCVKGYYNGCTGYSEDAATFDYYTNARSFICTIGYIEGCTVDKSTPTINSNTLSEGGTDSSAGSGKRIYTVEEARAAVEAAGTDTVNFRIRYK
ncbi:MAG: hypothetical protein J6X42_05040, partial [Alphaproteobacteria bacterium]|nr:hypothetical protein [Alphaproteobacteria bacterium]